MRGPRKADVAMRTRAASLLAAVAAGWLAVAAAAARAQTEPVPSTPALLTGTLAKARDSGTVTIGYRESSIPFSFLSPRQEPIGYSIELCKAIVEAMSDAVHKTLATKWVAVTPATRIEAVASGQVDLECGSTTSNLELSLIHI